MNKYFFLFIVTFLLRLSSQAQEIYYISPSSEPWGQVTNINVMNSQFGSGNWIHEYIPTVNVSNVFDGGTSFVFLDASDNSTSLLSGFLTPSNIAIIEAWVNAGGRLFLNCAPQGGSNIDLGFGVTLVPDLFSNYAYIASGQGAHPIFNGP